MDDRHSGLRGKLTNLPTGARYTFNKNDVSDYHYGREAVHNKMCIRDRVKSVQQGMVQVGPYELQVSRPRRKAFLAALADHIGGEGA